MARIKMGFLPHTSFSPTSTISVDTLSSNIKTNIPGLILGYLLAFTLHSPTCQPRPQNISQPINDIHVINMPVLIAVASDPHLVEQPPLVSHSWLP